MSQQRVANTVDESPTSSDPNGASAAGCSDRGCRSTMITCKGVSVACPCMRGDPPSFRRVEETNSVEDKLLRGRYVYRPQPMCIWFKRRFGSRLAEENRDVGLGALTHCF